MSIMNQVGKVGLKELAFHPSALLL